MARLVPRSAPLIDAWSRSRSAPSSRPRSLSSKWWTDAVERKKRLGRDAGQLGQHLVGEGRVGDRLAVVVEADRALAAGERLLDRAGLARRPRRPARTRSVMTERASVGASHGRSASSSPAVLVTRRVRTSSSARWIVVLPASFGPRTTVSPGAKVDVEVAVAAEVAGSSSRRILTARPRGRPAAAGRAAARRAARPPRPSEPAASSSAIRASRSRMKAPTIVSGDGSGPSVRAGSETSRTRTLRNDGASAVSISSRSQVELVGPDADEPDVEDEVGIGRAARLSTRAGWLADGAGVDLELLEARPADLPLLDRDGRLRRRARRARPAAPCRPDPGRARPPPARRRRRRSPCRPGPVWAECQWPSAR